MLHLNSKRVWILLISVQVSVLCLSPVNSHYPRDVERRGHRRSRTNQKTAASRETRETHIVQRGDGWTSEKKTHGPVSSSSSHHSVVRDRRSTLTRFNPGHTLPLAQNVPAPSAFGVKFHKCAQVKLDSDPPRLLLFLLIHNMGPSHGSNLSQVAVRDSISGIVPFRSEGREVEQGYQTFTIDFLYAGSQAVVNYSAHIRNPKSGVLELPAFLTFSNASQNDVNMFGPVTANLTLRVNSTDGSFPNHVVHFAGFVGGFFLSLVLLLSGFVALNLIDPSTTLRFCQHRRTRGGPDPEYGDCNVNDGVKDEAWFEDKMVDVMVLEDPQNMLKALENLEMSSLLHATNHLEAARVQIYKDLMVALLSRGDGRLLDVLHGQLLGAEGRLKEELGVRVGALAAQCNMETREDMEEEHLKETAEKNQGERLCQHADTQTVLQCSLLLEKLHKLSQSWLQRLLLVRHEEASAQVQREIVELRRVELHKIFCEELEEATRMGEMDKNTANSLQHDYFTCQDHLEEVLDVVLANQRYVLGERQAQRKFLVHSLQSLHSFISDTFSSASQRLDSYFTLIKRGSSLTSDQCDQFYDKSQKELLRLRQRLDEALTEEKRGLRCGLIKKRRELASDMLRLHRQREKDLSSTAPSLEGTAQILHHLQCWQNLLTAHSRELSDLIKTLDEEAAADIRKVTTRLLHDTVTELRAIQPSVVQSLQAVVPPGERPLLQTEDTAPGPGGVTVMLGQDRLQQDGQAALHTLRASREQLQRNMEEELMEQREVRERSRAFFRSLCSSQLTLSEDDRLQMKLEFQKSLSLMDRSLVLPPAVHRAKLHKALEEWRKDHEKNMTRANVKSGESKHKPDSELRLFQKRLEERIQLFDKHKELETGFKGEVDSEMQRDRQDYLLSLADTLASQMTTLHHEKAQRRSRLVEMSGALVSVQKLLVQQLRQRKNSERQNMADSIQSHCRGLSETEEQLQTDLDSLGLNPPAPEVFEGEECELEPDCRMVSILQGALHKCEQLMALLHQRCEEVTVRNQVMEHLKEQMELRRLQENCYQELEFASRLVKLTQVSSDVLKEVLRLLLPSAPESELLSVSDVLCPKHSTSPPADQQHSGLSSSLSRRLAAKVKEDVLSETIIRPTCIAQTQRIHEKRRRLMEKLFLSVCPESPPDVPLIVVEQKDGNSPTSEAPRDNPVLNNPGSDNPVLNNPGADNPRSDNPRSDRSIPALGGRLFVFRDPPPSAPDRSRRKRNFLNFKKNAVVPSNLT